MNVNLEEYNLLKKIADFETTMTGYEASIGWRWLDVGMYAATINRLVIKGLVRVSYKSHSSTNYLLTDEAKAVLASTQPIIEPVEAPSEAKIDVSKMFSDIIGYDNLKELLTESLQLEKPLHILLYGPPSICKSQFLLDIERAAGALALPLLGSATSHAGLWDLIAERSPRYLLIDELEKLPLADMAGLLSLMEQGRIIRAKVGRKLDIKLDIRVLAAANRITNLPPELLSRFAKFHLNEYSASEYVIVVESVLTHQEGLLEGDAHNIAFRLVGKTHDIRDAIRVGRLSTRVGVERAVELLIHPSEEDRG